MGTLLMQEDPAPQATGHICADCGEGLTYTQEVWSVQVVQPQNFGGKTFFHTIIDEDDPSGDFLFEPYFFCFGCWENLYEAIKEEHDDTPPFLDADSKFECVCCGSGIREWEYAGTFTLGELLVSKRAPNGVRGPHFESNGKPELLCLYCLVLINEGHIEMWDGLSQFGECNDCIQIRCWREAACGCGCHIDAPEEVEEHVHAGE